MGYLSDASLLDLEIDRVERIDSTRLKIDRLDRSTRLQPILSTDLTRLKIDRLDSLPTVYRPINFRCATLVEQRVFHRHVCLSVTSMYCVRGY